MATGSFAQPPPLDVTHHFAPERRSLLSVLSSLTDRQWATPTACPGWTVKDVALHVLGVDHEKLTYRYAGRDFRLTDVYGQVVHELLA